MKLSQQPLKLREPLENKELESTMNQEEPPVFDREDFWERMEGDMAILPNLINIFKKTVPKLLDALSECLRTAENHESLFRNAHSIKGAAANVSAAAMRTIATRLEQAARDCRYDDMKSLLPLLRAEYARFLSVAEQQPVGK